jgi:hypothetical protein
MPEEQTIRQRAEAIRERHGATLANQADFLTYSDAEAIIAALDDPELSVDPPEWFYQAFAAAIGAPEGTRGQHLWRSLALLNAAKDAPDA